MLIAQLACVGVGRPSPLIPSPSAASWCGQASEVPLAVSEDPGRSLSEVELSLYPFVTLTLMQRAEGGSLTMQWG